VYLEVESDALLGNLRNVGGLDVNRVAAAAEGKRRWRGS